MTIRKLAIAAALIGAALLPASAADLPRGPMVTKAPVIAPAFNWTGFYLGAYGGYAWGSGDTSGFDGGIAGGTIGYNWQAPGSMWVFGIEGDGGWTNFGDSLTVTGAGVTATAFSEAEAMATLRARLGVAWDRTLFYVTGGGAWVSNEIGLNVTVAGIGTAGISDSQNHFGYVVGGGIEHAFLPNWSAKVEYLYLGLGSETYFGTASSGDVDVHTIKLGLNYRFGR
jgi:outer membrane immunogenic protein